MDEIIANLEKEIMSISSRMDETDPLAEEYAVLQSRREKVQKELIDARSSDTESYFKERELDIRQQKNDEDLNLEREKLSNQKKSDKRKFFQDLGMWLGGIALYGTMWFVSFACQDELLQPKYLRDMTSSAKDIFSLNKRK